jgi:hypothetical protein
MKMSRQQQQIAADARRAAKREAHSALMARHAARKTAWEQYVAAYDAWLAAGERGPKPVDPRNLPAHA